VVVCFLISLLVLVPCFWHSRIQAGDLSSHVYNCWLVLQLEHQPVPGLAVVPQWTNVVFDLALTELLRVFGPDAAQRIAVSVCVLVFFWGSFLFVRTIAGRPVWWSAPAVGMLSYGWLFHSGFFNYYLSAGLCFFAISFWLRGQKILALALVPLALTGHALPVLWAAGSVIFLAAARRYPRLAFPVVLTLVTAVCLFLHAQPYSVWSPIQVQSMVGFDQLDVFEPKYVAVVFAALALLGLLFWRQLRQSGGRTLLASPEIQLTALLSLAMIIMPLSVPVPGKFVLLGYIPTRLSVCVALLILALVGRIPVPRWAPVAFGICMIAFGTLLYQDTRDYNAWEDRLTAELDRNARGQRVVIAAKPISRRNNLEVNVTVHLIDRACLGRCYSYANYEPSTQVFRLRATGPNPLVVDSYRDSINMQSGKYVVSEKDLPLLQANLCGAEEPVTVTPLHAGDFAGSPHCR
jgi:hypothetical protein